MQQLHRSFIFIVLLLCLGCSNLNNNTPPPQDGQPSSFSTPVPVEVRNDNGHYQIYRGGKPFFIKGAGGSSHLLALADAGGNAFRTWSTYNAKQLLDEAHRNGLVVMLGISLGHERHGFDYSDKQAVQKQFERVQDEVLEYKDHPALLAWAIGNEVDLFYTNPDVWYAVEQIASFIQQVDEYHLVTTVTAGIDKEKLNLIQKRVPSLDFLSINIYGGLSSLPQDLLDMGYAGPFVITEWGPTGHWQVRKTNWEAPIEQTSSEKAASYQQRYEQGIVNAKGKALGSFAFLWGQKQETTPTWYGVFTESGNPTEAVDTLTYNWTGKWPDERAPSIERITLERKSRFDNIKVQAEQRISAEVIFTSSQDNSPAIQWEVLPESTDIKAGGDPESRPQPVKGLNVTSNGKGKVTLDAPATPGAYRLFVYVTNANGKAAYANIPFWVNGA
ncbi:glycoside hydrolase family 2 TIM barrel-domain containing protein [Alteromonas sp. ASW11-130]|uniref:glycoside hydrolase family 2 TIM barrel-domain containing protein n=1 Tax=Alteromonas sp. ASW11-130 TaxID=3015775 RepID=UPI0022422CB6|nr:glycoside hydrolase family 2 TIM barrel-domain containing protein [Alteromonas sp. ASW11-130]MCW8091506.1 hypothetical protein [Alteromonas sp. ASW11-130]